MNGLLADVWFDGGLVLFLALLGVAFRRGQALYDRHMAARQKNVAGSMGRHPAGNQLREGIRDGRADGFRHAGGSGCCGAPPDVVLTAAEEIAAGHMALLYDVVTHDEVTYPSRKG